MLEREGWGVEKKAARYNFEQAFNYFGSLKSSIKDI